MVITVGLANNHITAQSYKLFLSLSSIPLSSFKYAIQYY